MDEQPQCSNFDRDDLFSDGETIHGTAKYLGPNTGNRYDFQTMKATNICSKRSIRSELTKTELLNMLAFLEGELQAREIVVAALRNERIKTYLHLIQSKPIGISDPYATLFRDRIATNGGIVSHQSSALAIQADLEMKALTEQQIESLYHRVTKQRETHIRMVKFIKESLDNNQKMRNELEEEKRKHEHDTAQGDDITYGLEMERTKLKQELDIEKNNRKKLEKDLKKIQENLDYEKDREKQIVLFLLAERKKIFTKYVEERKRSEDLAQILSEEKQRSDAIAEGLEEESKKSLQMEAELEKQSLSIENERKAMKINLAKEEKRIKDLEAEVAHLRVENEALRKQNSTPLRIQSSQQHNVSSVPSLPTKVRSLPDDSGTTASSSVVNVAKIVQPTATVSSVPVSGPTTGIARSISPGQSLRQQPSELSSAAAAGYSSVAGANKVPTRKMPNSPAAAAPGGSISSGTGGMPISASAGGLTIMQCSSSVQQQQSLISSSVSAIISSVSATISAGGGVISDLQQQQQQQNSIPLGGGASINQSSPISHVNLALSQQQHQHQHQTATILRASSASGHHFHSSSTTNNIPPNISTTGQQSMTSSSSSGGFINNTVGSSSSNNSFISGGGNMTNCNKNSTTSSNGSNSTNIVLNAAANATGIISSIPPSSNNIASTVGSSSGGVVIPPNSSTMINNAVTAAVTRGAPPPIPPNKPIVPPKREPSLSRLGSITANK